VTTGKNILLVEDEPSVAEALSLVIAQQGFKVAIANNGRHALDIIEDACPDLVITDFMMPHMNGAELAAALRADSRWADVPIVVMSAASETAMRRHVGFDAYLRKPFEMRALFEAVRRLVG